MKEQDNLVGRITVVEAFRRLSEKIERNEQARRFPDEVSLYGSVQMHEVGKEPDPPRPPSKSSEHRVSGKAIAIDQLKSSFLAYCLAAGVTPRSLHNPWGAEPYTGEAGDDFTYDISNAEYDGWAAPYLEPTNTRSPTVAPGRPSIGREIPQIGSAEGLTRRERQICAIEQKAKDAKYDLLMIPTGGKSVLRDICMKTLPELFGAGPDPFNDAWKDAISQEPPRLRMADHDKFGNR